VPWFRISLIRGQEVIEPQRMAVAVDDHSRDRGIWASPKVRTTRPMGSRVSDPATRSFQTASGTITLDARDQPLVPARPGFPIRRDQLAPRL
jgi:hypothetical protein